MSKIQLKQEEAEQLLNALKKSIVDSINFPKKGENEVFEVESVINGDIFKIRIYRGKVNRDKYNFGAMIEKYGILILELHIGSGNRHTNPDGTVIEGSHWHIYSETYGRNQAFSADNVASERFVENTIAFLDKFNVIEKPVVHCQHEPV